MRAFRGQLTGKKLRDAFHGVTLPKVLIRDHRKPENYDVVSIADGLLYFYRDTGGEYLTDQVIAFDGRGHELGRVTAPSSPRSLDEGSKRNVTVVPSVPIFVVERVRPLGRHPRAETAALERVTIRLTKTERQRWKVAARERSLGDWIRDACNGYIARGSR
jgi:hypothetical protein